MSELYLTGFFMQYKKENPSSYSYWGQIFPLKKVLVHHFQRGQL